MVHTDKTREQLIAELETLRASVAELEAVEAERKQAVEDVLHESGERFRLLAENSPDYIYILDVKQHKAVYFNRQEFLGYGPHDFLAADSLLDSLHPRDREWVLQHWRQLTTGKGSDTLAIEYRLRRKRGDWEWIHSRETVIARDAQGNPSQILFNLTLITERKRVEEALAESEEIFSSFMEYSPIYVFFKDEKIRSIRLSRNYEQMLGRPLHELLGKTMDELFPSQLAKSMEEDDRRILREGKPFEVVEELEGRIYETLKFPIVRQGKPDLLAGFTVDITERKRAEEALRQSNLELQARNEELDAFGHMVAHDLKGPLADIVGYADVLADSNNPVPEEDVRRLAPTILEMGLKMDSIIEELMLLTGLRRMDVKMEPLDMAAIVDQAQRRLARMIKEAHATIICPASWPIALGYASWIEEVWINYLSNAVKYGGKPARAQLGATREGNCVRFWVRDNGPGLSSEEQARLFAPFERLDQMHITGYGLGLSIVRRIVERMGGQVSVESAGVPGEGSMFSFALPAADEKP